MENLKTIVVPLLLFLLLGCKEESIENKVEHRFKEHVNKTFDNPNNFIEIVDVCVLDTFDTRTFKQFCNDYSTLLDSIKTVNKNWIDSLPEFLKSLPKSKTVKLSQNSTFKWKWKEYLNHVDPDKILQMQFNGQLILPDIPKEIAEFKDTVFYEYKISYRVQEQDLLKLKQIIATCDTLGNNIAFYPESSYSNYSNDIQNFLKAAQNYISSALRTIDYETETLKLSSVLDAFMKD